jgi:mannose-1-phosphate guanylyltransferase
MKAFLLAAGHGTRLRPLTNELPKCLVTIRGVPILEIWLNIFARVGITEVLLNVHAHADAVRATVDRCRSPVQIDISEEPVLLGSAGTVLANRAWVGSDKEFWILYADVLTTFDLKAMLGFHRGRRPVATVGVYEVSEPSRCGIVRVDQNWIVQEFVEKPAIPTSNLAFAGLMVGTPELFEFIPAKQPADLGFDVLSHLGGRMLAYPLTDYVIDIGTIETYREAQVSWPGLN